jgi:hypothetical protein
MAKHIVPLYADLIERMDADGQQLVADLHAFFNPAMPSRLQAAPPLVAPRTLGPKWHWPQWHWPRTALIALLAIFALVGATYIVALPLLQPLWSEDRGLQHVAQAGLARDLNLKQTIDGVTVHVRKGYADANRVAIGYSVELPPTTPGDDGPQFSSAILTDDHGNTYPGLGFSLAGDSLLGAQLYNFEPIGVTAGRDVAFTLTIPEVVRAPKGGGTVRTFRGPWVFNFTLPMAAARVVETALTFTRPGVELTITRIVVAPSATRFEYRVHLEGFTDRVGANLELFGSGRGGGNNGFVTRGYVSPGRARGSGGLWCQPDVECSYLLREPLLDADAFHAYALITIPPRDPCPPLQKCEVGRDGKPFMIRIDGLVLPLR